MKRADAEYAATFRKAGMDLDTIQPAEAGKWIAARSEFLELAGYLDDWAYIRIKAQRAEADWRGCWQPHGPPTPIRGATPSEPSSGPRTPWQSPSSDGWPAARHQETCVRS